MILWTFEENSISDERMNVVEEFECHLLKMFDNFDFQFGFRQAAVLTGGLLLA